MNRHVYSVTYCILSFNFFDLKISVSVYHNIHVCILYVLSIDHKTFKTFRSFRSMC